MQQQNTLPITKPIVSECTQQLESNHFSKISCTEQTELATLPQFSRKMNFAPKIKFSTTSELQFLEKSSDIPKKEENLATTPSSLLFDFTQQIIPSVEEIAKSQISTLLAKKTTDNGNFIIAPS